MQPPDKGAQHESDLESGPEKQTEKVGYGKPPIGTRFRKGQSGNPKGRPKGAKNFKTLLEEALNEKVTVNENGRRKAISKKRAGAKHVANKIASGDVTMALRLLEWELRQEAAKKPAEQIESGRVVPAPGTALEQLIEITKRFQDRIAKREAQKS